MLKRNLSPMDFLDSECRVTPWKDYGHFGMKAYRIWVCRTGIAWFQRHEWLPEGANQSQLEPWIPSNKSFDGATLPAPDEEEFY